MKDRYLCSPPTFPWPRSGPPTFFILESPLMVDRVWVGPDQSLQVIMQVRGMCNASIYPTIKTQLLFLIFSNKLLC